MEALSIHAMCESIHLVVQLTTAAAENFNVGPLLPILFTVLGYLEGRHYRIAMPKTVHPEVTATSRVFSFRRSLPKHSYTPGMHIRVRTVGSGL